MAAATETTSLRAIVVLPESVEVEKHPGVRLLRELGHHVSPASSPDDAIGLLQSAHTDLLVVDLPDDAERRQVFDTLSTLPARQRPRQAAVFSDGLDEYVRQLRVSSADRPKVHVFLKPLHLHGLLNVLRSIQSRGDGRAVPTCG